LEKFNFALLLLGFFNTIWGIYLLLDFAVKPLTKATVLRAIASILCLIIGASIIAFQLGHMKVRKEV